MAEALTGRDPGARCLEGRACDTGSVEFRGCGRTSERGWAACAVIEAGDPGACCKDVEGEDYVELHGMSYSDAKKAAVKWAKSKGHTSLFVAT